MIESPQVKLRKLFTPLNHDKITLKNRIMQMAMLTRFCDDKGHMTDRYIDFMTARAKGGTGLLTSEATYLTADSRYRPNQMAVYDDSYIPGMKKLVDAVHQFDCKITLQVMHAGTRLSESYLPGSKPVGPSGVPHIPTGVVPHELTEKEIEYLFSQEVLPFFEVITVQSGQPFVIDDPSDDKFIWCALEGHAQAIISSDQHLLSLSSCPVPIFSPSEFLRVECRK